MIRILLADNQAIFRAGLQIAITREPDMEVVGEASNVQDTIRLATELKPDILLLGLASPASAAALVLQGLSAVTAARHTIVMPGTDDKAQLAGCVKNGVRGIIMQESSVQQLLEAIRCVTRGGFWVCDKCVADRTAALRELLDPGRGEAGRDRFSLTRRELEIVSRIVSGFSNREISTKLQISEETVKHHVTSIFDKVGVYNRLELALFAIHHGLTAEVKKDAAAGKSVRKKAKAAGGGTR